jgi:pimeloyl-ACP methyl ester carboxylesterase
MSRLPYADRSAAPWSLLGLEPMRAVFEYASMHLMDTASFPPGDGHPVVIFPGLVSDHNSTAPLKEFCRKLGYTAYDWGQGINTGPQGDLDAWIDKLAGQVRELTSAHRQRMSLIGWSLGGICAREVAKKLQGRMRHVITLGTPFGGTAERNDLAWIYGSLGAQQPEITKDLMARLSSAPDVPTVSIYSRSGGVVNWQACLHDETQGQTEDIEVDSSHLGLGWNPQALSIIADRLGNRKNSAPSAPWSRRRTERATALLLAMESGGEASADVGRDEPSFRGDNKTSANGRQ